MMLTPLHGRISNWAEQRFQHDLVTLKSELPDLLAVLSAAASLRMLAAAHRAGRGIVAEAILLLENRVAGLADALAEFPADIPVFVAHERVFDAIAGFNMHRGVLALGRRDLSP